MDKTPLGRRIEGPAVTDDLTVDALIDYLRQFPKDAYVYIRRGERLERVQDVERVNEHDVLLD